MNHSFFLPTYALVAWLLTPFPGHGSVPHEYADGFVERSVAIVVRDQRGYGEYLIGLNEQTARDCLQREADASSEDPEGSAAEEAATEPDEGNSGASPSASADAGSGQHLTDLAIIESLGRLKSRWFTDHFSVQAKDQTIELENIEVGPAPRHPYSLLVKFEFSLAPTLPDDDRSDRPHVVQLTIDDRLFKDQQGAVRYALKTSRRSMLLQSNVSPILVRADRVLLDELTPDGRRKATQIRAKVAIPRESD